MPNLFVELVAPDRKVFQGEAQSVNAPGVLGSFTVLYNHAPMLAAFRVGTLAITTPDGTRISYATNGGFLEVIDNRVTVLAESAEPASDIDVDLAQEVAESAREQLSAATSPEARRAAEQELERARNRLRVAMSRVSTRS